MWNYEVCNDMRAYAEVVPSIAEANDVNVRLYYLRDKHVVC